MTLCHIPLNSLHSYTSRNSINQGLCGVYLNICHDCTSMCFFVHCVYMLCAFGDIVLWDLPNWIPFAFAMPLCIFVFHTYVAYSFISAQLNKDLQFYVYYYKSIAGVSNIRLSGLNRTARGPNLERRTTSILECSWGIRNTLHSICSWTHLCLVT